MSAGFPTGAALLAARNAVPSAPTSPNRPPNLQRASKIRFAPLPEIRPRAYSTGRNVWIVEEDDPSASSGRRQRLVRVNGEYDDDDEDFTGDSDFARFDDDSALGTSPSNSLMKWGSWTEALGLTPSTSRRSADEDALSLTSSVSPSSESGLSAAFGSPGSGGSSKKILKALGLGGKTAKTKRTGKENDDHLTRTSSTESHGSHGRRASVSEGTAPPRPPGSTGIPMQRSSTWEIGDMPEPKGPEIAGERGAGPVYYASPARTSRRRAQYPPVAQGRNRRSRTRGNVAVEEPAFEEWGAVGVGSNAKKRSVVGSAPSDRGFDEDDDGTGMAWLRRRRLQREQEERERALQEVTLAEASTQAESAQAPAPLQLSDPNEVPAETTIAEENQDTLTRDPTQRGPADEDRRMPLPFLIRTPPSRSGTVDSTVSTASTIRPSSPVTSIKPSGLSATRPVLAVDTHAETASDIESQEELAPLSPGEIGDEEDEVTIESECDSSEAESEDDDLDEEELAREEALAEEARRMAKSMGPFHSPVRDLLACEADQGQHCAGAERYHSARHENQLKVVDA